MSDWSEGNWDLGQDFSLPVDWNSNMGMDNYDLGWDFNNPTQSGFSDFQDYTNNQGTIMDQMFPNFSPMGTTEMFDSMYPAGNYTVPGVDLSAPRNVLETMGYSNPMEGWGTPTELMPSKPNVNQIANLGFGALRALMDLKSGKSMRDAYTNVANSRMTAANQVKSPPFNELKYRMLTTNDYNKSPVFQQMLRDMKKQLLTRQAGGGQIGSGMGTLLNSGLVSQTLKDYIGMIPNEDNSTFAQLLQGAGEPQIGAARTNNSRNAQLMMDLQNIWRTMNTKDSTSGNSFYNTIFGNFAS